MAVIMCSFIFIHNTKCKINKPFTFFDVNKPNDNKIIHDVTPMEKILEQLVCIVVAMNVKFCSDDLV